MPGVVEIPPPVFKDADGNLMEQYQMPVIQPPPQEQIIIGTAMDEVEDKKEGKE